MSEVKFSELGLLPEMQRAIDELGFETATDIQAEAIPAVREGRDVIGKSQTGTGKTLAFAIPAIEKIDRSLLEAAADLGASPRKSFLRVTLPYSIPGVLEGITMVFVPAVTTFVISQLMGGGKVPLIGDIIQNQFGKSSDWHFGSTLSLLVMVVVLAFMGGLNRIDKEEEPQKEVRIL